MNLSDYFWYFKSALTPRFCDEVIKYALQQKDDIARTGGFNKPKLSKEDIKNIQRKRKSDLVWFNDTWIYKEIHPFVHEANRNAGWNFEWDRSESCQFTKYKQGQYYDWHCDSWDKPLSNNEFIMFPSTQMYYITNNQKDSLNSILTITHEFI